VDASKWESAVACAPGRIRKKASLKEGMSRKIRALKGRRDLRKTKGGQWTGLRSYQIGTRISAVFLAWFGLRWMWRGSLYDGAQSIEAFQKNIETGNDLVLDLSDPHTSATMSSIEPILMWYKSPESIKIIRSSPIDS